MTEDGLARLRELTEQLPALGDVVLRVGASYVEYDVKGGLAFGFDLFQNKAVLVSRCIATVGCQFQRHAHRGIERYILYAGKVRFTTGEQTQELGPGDEAIVPPEVEHEISVIERAQVIIVRIPAEGGYPYVDHVEA